MDYMLTLLVEEILINEMKSDIIDYINQKINPEHKPFDEIFRGKNRIYVPIKDEKERDISKIKKLLEDNMVGYVAFDPSNFMVTKKVSLDPKYGRGSSKEIQIGLGKAIRDLDITEVEKNSYIDWLAMHRVSLTNPEKYGIIISRAPVDIVRMSDMNNIKSCHSRGKNFFRCALEESLSGGAIAYLVRESELEDIQSSEEFQNGDIFYDEDRGVGKAIVPRARIRIRLVELGDGKEVALVDPRIYTGAMNPDDMDDDHRLPVEIPNFMESLIEFLKSKQDLKVEDFMSGDITLKGGSYYDLSIDDALRKYFPKEEYKKYLDFTKGSQNYKHPQGIYKKERGHEYHALGKPTTIGDKIEDNIDDINNEINLRRSQTVTDHGLIDGEWYYSFRGTYTIPITNESEVTFFAKGMPHNIDIVRSKNIDYEIIYKLYKELGNILRRDYNMTLLSLELRETTFLVKMTGAVEAGVFDDGFYYDVEVEAYREFRENMAKLEKSKGFADSVTHFLS